MPVSELLLRIVLSFVVLFIFMKIEGRKDLSQMTFFNFVKSITIGSIAASLVTDNNFSILNGVIAIVGWSLLTFILDIIDIKSIRGRKVVTGVPEIVIKDGRLSRSAMKKTRLDVNQLSALLRQKNVFSFTAVDYAIFETSGRLSVLLKEEKQFATKSDINKTIGDKMFPFNLLVISDGIVRRDNLERLHLDENWLQDEIKKAGFNSPKEIFVAELQTDGTLYIDKYD